VLTARAGTRKVSGAHEKVAEAAARS
jgi:hypothetical protein